MVQRKNKIHTPQGRTHSKKRWRKMKRQPYIESQEIREAFDRGKSMQRNLADMGLTFDVNSLACFAIPGARESLVKELEQTTEIGVVSHFITPSGKMLRLEETLEDQPYIEISNAPKKCVSDAIAADAERQAGQRPTWISEADALLCARLVRRYGERGLLASSGSEADALYARAQRDFSVNPFQLTVAQLRRLLQRFARAPDGVYARLLGHPPPISISPVAIENANREQLDGGEEDMQERVGDEPVDDTGGEVGGVEERSTEREVSPRRENPGRVIQLDMA